MWEGIGPLDSGPEKYSHTFEHRFERFSIHNAVQKGLDDSSDFWKTCLFSRIRRLSRMSGVLCVSLYNDDPRHFGEEVRTNWPPFRGPMDEGCLFRIRPHYHCPGSLQPPSSPECFAAIWKIISCFKQLDPTGLYSTPALDRRVR